MSSAEDSAARQLPFTLEFVELPDDPSRPALQSYSPLIDADGMVYVLGGRRLGLHQFRTSGDNFPSPNQSLWRLDPTSGAVEELLDLRLLNPGIGDPLMSTNQQSFDDRRAGEWLIVGGYGTDSQGGADRTFDTLIRIPCSRLIEVLNWPAAPAAKVAELERIIHCQHDPFFAVTGGYLRALAGRYLIMFGQGFQGAYDPFAGIVAQQYTNAVRYFRLGEQMRDATCMGELISPDADQPFHRRDGPIVDTIDPATGAPRVTAFGGVFPPGKLDGYMNPVCVDEARNCVTANTDRSATQLFNQYDCPTVVVWDSSGRTVYHTFFGGISRYYYHQTPEQAAVYKEVTAEGRNDGLPFVADVTTMLQRADGSWEEYLAPAPIPGNYLRGAGAEFLPVPPTPSGPVSEAGVIQLANIGPGERVVVGHIYGGIQADFPLPKIPNYGSQATNALYQVVLTKAPSPPQLPASDGHRANGVVKPPPPPA